MIYIYQRSYLDDSVTAFSEETEKEMEPKGRVVDKVGGRTRMGCVNLRTLHTENKKTGREGNQILRVPQRTLEPEVSPQHSDLAFGNSSP